MTLFIDTLCVRYGAAPVIRDVTDTWRDGEVTALIGCNGAGKSTLLKAVAGLLPAQGTVRLDGIPLPPADRGRHIAYMPQETGAASSLTVLEVVLLGRLRSLSMRLPSALIAKAVTALDTFGLAHLQTRRLDELSGGQRQLVFLTQALFRAPRVLLLDEPTAALDLRHQLLVLERLRHLAASTGTIVAMALHDLNLAAQFTDRLIALHGGEFRAAGAAEDVLNRDNLAAMYGIEADVLRLGNARLQVMPLRATTKAGAPS
ncbi:ABC transporter ATP-binding protein [Roseovarius sp. MMSF_3281]|uniref:ABC transporter ATP-binding protein n=1 Tax=Roseovarius sp. MMSF_3281 TaxID=3046694 RepID=UPI00273E862E|nr:ABC transporter ATP-binding protein [Roseovarius sp. MMSF_3281]